MKDLKVVACPVNKGEHYLHKHRYIMTADAKLEPSVTIPGDFRAVNGSIVCKMTDIQDQDKYAKLFAAAPDLLEACGAAENQMHNSRKFKDGSYAIHIPAEMAKCIKAAIAKAKETL